MELLEFKLLMVKDLNLPEYMSNSIAISISEQMCGLDVPFDTTGWGKTEKTSTSNVTGSKKVPVNRMVPAAWKAEEKEDNNFANHLLNIGKPTQVNGKAIK